MMKKSRPKLASRKETLRALATMNLAHAVGGNGAGDITGKVECPAPAVVPRR
jgi:hypothetical protein